MAKKIRIVSAFILAAFIAVYHYILHSAGLSVPMVTLLLFLGVGLAIRYSSSFGISLN